MAQIKKQEWYPGLKNAAFSQDNKLNWAKMNARFAYINIFLYSRNELQTAENEKRCSTKMQSFFTVFFSEERLHFVGHLFSISAFRILLRL